MLLNFNESISLSRERFKKTASIIFLQKNYDFKSDRGLPVITVL